MSTHPNTGDRRSRLLSLASRAVPLFQHTRNSSEQSSQPLKGSSSPTSTQHRFQRSPSPSYSSDHSHSGQMPEQVSYRDVLAPPVPPYAPVQTGESGMSSRRSSFSSMDKGGSSMKNRPSSLSINYVPAKFSKLHEPGQWAHRRAKQGGGRDAFAQNAQRMGDLGTVDDDEGIVFQLGKGGLKRKTKPKLRWNRFKWFLFLANTLLIAYGLATLVSAILVWLNVFYQADVIRVGNTTELIISTVAASLIVLTSLIGYAGVVLNNRAFLAVYTLLLWVCLGLIVTPGYISYKKRTFNLEGKINAQWSRDLGLNGRLRVQDALRCCGYYDPFVEATVSPMCYGRSILPGCKNKYLHIERHVLEIWYAIAFALVPVHILIILTALLCSNHITYRFGKGMTPKQYRLDLGSMAVIMDEYAGQIAAKYGPNLAAEAVNRSSTMLNLDPKYDEYSLPSNSRRDSFAAAGLAVPMLSPGLGKVSARLANIRPSFPEANTRSGHSDNYSSKPVYGSALFDHKRDSLDLPRSDDGGSRNMAGRGDPAGSRYLDAEPDRSDGVRLQSQNSSYEEGSRDSYGYAGSSTTYGSSTGYNGTGASAKGGHGWGR